MTRSEVTVFVAVRLEPTLEGVLRMLDRLNLAGKSGGDASARLDCIGPGSRCHDAGRRKSARRNKLLSTSLRARTEVLLLRAGLGLLRALGPVGASNLAGALARSIGPFLPVSGVADANLRAALPVLDHAARRRVVRGVWDNLGRMVGELPHVGALSENTAHGPGWVLEGDAILDAARAAGKPVIFVSGHIGNWEMLPPVVARRGLPFASLYRAAANPAVDAEVVTLRRRALGVEVPMFPKGAAGARAALAHLRGGGHLGMLMDQKMNDGIVARFFGRDAMTAPALAALALRHRCLVIPGHVQRLGPARFRVVVEPPLALPDTGDRQADILTFTQSINDTLERWITARPESWLWLHRRWPKTGITQPRA